MGAIFHMLVVGVFFLAGGFLPLAGGVKGDVTLVLAGVVAIFFALRIPYEKGQPPLVAEIAKGEHKFLGNLLPVLMPAVLGVFGYLVRILFGAAG